MNSQTDSVLCIARTTLENKPLFYIEFANSGGLLDFQLRTGSGALFNDYGTLVIPVDPTSDYKLVTLHGVFSALSNDHIQRELCIYGEVGPIYRGFHWTQGSTIENGKRYIMFRGELKRHLPSRLKIGEYMVLVKYIGQPPLCSSCGLAGHRYPLCGKGPGQPETSPSQASHTVNTKDPPELHVIEREEAWTQQTTHSQSSIECDLTTCTRMSSTGTQTETNETSPQVCDVGVLVKAKTRDIGFTIHPAKVTHNVQTMTKQINNVSRESNTDHVQHKGVRTQTESQGKTTGTQCGVPTCSKFHKL
jgi:hypothetical protein